MLAFNFHIGDFTKKTMHLTHEERGIYLALLMRYYDTEEPLPPDTESVCRLVCARNADAMRLVCDVLAEFFQLHDDGWRNPRADEEIAKFRIKSGKAKQSATTRWEREKARREAAAKESEASKHDDADAMRTHSEGNANHEPRTTNHEPRTEKVKPSCRPAADDSVQRIFDHWLMRMGKTAQAKLTDKRRKCIQARLREGYDVDLIMRAIDGCAASPHHMGQNDAGTVYDDLTLICRTGDKLEWFANSVAAVKTMNSQERQEAGNKERLMAWAERKKREMEEQENEQG